MEKSIHRVHSFPVCRFYCVKRLIENEVLRKDLKEVMYVFWESDPGTRNSQGERAELLKEQGIF